jgi:hypothetical protein
MNVLFILCGILLTVIAVLHSLLGEWYLIRPLYQADVPKLFGSRTFARRTIRFVWHLLTIAWAACGLVFLYWATLEYSRVVVVSARILGVAWLLSSLVSLVVTRGRHWISWVGFLIIGILALAGSL